MRSDEYHQTTIEVSLLSPLTPVDVRDEADAIGVLRPGIDGVVLQHGNNRGTFLPQVWESLPEPERFLTELKRYSVYKWTED